MAAQTPLISTFFMGFKIIEFNFVWAVLQGSPDDSNVRILLRIHPDEFYFTLTTLTLIFRLQQDRLLSDLTRSQQFMGSGVSSPGSFMPDPRIFQYRPPGPPK